MSLEKCLNKQEADKLVEQISSSDISVKRSLIIPEILEYNKKGCYDCDGYNGSCQHNPNKKQNLELINV